MFIGHFGVGLAARAVAPRLGLGGGQAQWLIVLWGFWLDRHREPRT